MNGKSYKNILKRVLIVKKMETKVENKQSSGNDGNTLLCAVPDLTKVWEQVIEKYDGYPAERDKYCNALWELEKGGFIQLKFGL